MKKAFAGSVNLSGFGGTSFVPVFDWIRENKVKKGIDVSALIYLTDGMGTYPDETPDYPTYFVMPQFGAHYMQTHEPDKSWIRVLNMDIDDPSYDDDWY